MARDLDGTGKDFARDYERKRAELGGCGRFGAADCCSRSGDETPELSVWVSSRFTKLGNRAEGVSWP